MKSRSEKHTVLPSGDNKGTEQTQDRKSTRSSFRNVSAPLIKTEKPSPNCSTNLTDAMSHKSLQICHCGWSSVTTYHGLRTHQGINECTPRGQRIPQDQDSKCTSSSPNSLRHGSSEKDGDRKKRSSEKHTVLPSGDNKGTEQTQDRKSTRSSFRKVSAPLIKTEKPSANCSTNLTDEMSHKTLQRCHCGWSSVTTYHGLRTHQGINGCTPRGQRIPQDQDSKCTSSSSLLDPSTNLIETSLGQMRSELKHLIKKRVKKLDEVEQSIEVIKASAKKELEESWQVYAELQRLVEQSQAERVELIATREREAEKHAQEMARGLENELSQLRRWSSKLEAYARTNDPALLNLIALPPLPELTDWSKVSINTDLYLSTIRSSVSKLVEKFQEELKKLYSKEMELRHAASEERQDPARGRSSCKTDRPR
ncbi:uncharacterized protein LOC128755580 isoform X2 [Synchiropus splendidus]|uniref:uncharacterized protein LOC128755580 isoform X2 n=1 Tax=Synchiropus splendidus TaxID=270530 RepID=UPI00237DCDA8|nr:uncharacterized protein LOC128755580 isoform X2 [Synchiropus splendidus]